MPLLCSPEDVVVEAVRFWAGDSRLEGELIYPEGQPIGMAVLAGPHPLLGGSMHNNVVRRLGDGLAQYGLATLRFNYRGVGGSEGAVADPAAQLAAFWQTSHTADELLYQEDLAAACAFLRSAVDRDLPMVLAGYSFGCTLLPAAVLPGDISTALVLVAPTIGTHDYTGFESVTNPKLVIAPEEDFAINVMELSRWYTRLPGQKQFLRPKVDSHFFRGHEDWLVERVSDFLDSAWR
jgi:alpha/beta superfamily hydrolase